MSALEWSREALRAFPATLATLIESVPKEALDWQPASWDGIPSESLTIRQQLCHLRDIEVEGYAVRLARVLAEDNPDLPSIDTYELVKTRDYDRTGVKAALAAFSAGRQGTMRLIDGIAPQDLSRTGAFEGYGSVTLQGLIHYLCSHDQQHIAGIQWLLGQYARALG
jgi:hypothetical protein